MNVSLLVTLLKREEAEFGVERRKVTAELKKFAMTRAEVNAARYCKTVYHLYIDSADTLLTTTNYNGRTAGVLYFESEYKVQEAIRAVGEERIKKYYFGLED